MAKSARERIAEAERFSCGCREALALLYGPLPSENERREAARALGLEDALPNPQDELEFKNGL